VSDLIIPLVSVAVPMHELRAHQRLTGRGWAGFLPSKAGSKGEDTSKVPKTLSWRAIL